MGADSVGLPESGIIGGVMIVHLQTPLLVSLPFQSRRVKDVDYRMLEGAVISCPERFHLEAGLLNWPGNRISLKLLLG